MANEPLFPSSLFSLEEFSHASLFKQDTFIWEALNGLPKYLETFSHQGIACKVPEGVFLINPETVTIGPGTAIEPGAYIQGPCVIGSGCTVRYGAYIRGFLITGDHCVIGHATEVKNAIFLNDVHAAHFAYVGDSILGNRVNLGAGTRCANLRFDHEEVVVVDSSGKRISSGRKKLGAIMGDDAQTGCNAVLNPGSVMERGAVCYPCTNVGRYIRSPEKRVIRS